MLLLQRPLWTRRSQAKLLRSLSATQCSQAAPLLRSPSLGRSGALLLPRFSRPPFWPTEPLPRFWSTRCSLAPPWPSLSSTRSSLSPLLPRFPWPRCSQAVSLLRFSVPRCSRTPLLQRPSSTRRSQAKLLRSFSWTQCSQAAPLLRSPSLGCSGALLLPRLSLPRFTILANATSVVIRTSGSWSLGRGDAIRHTIHRAAGRSALASNDVCTAGWATSFLAPMVQGEPCCGARSKRAHGGEMRDTISKTLHKATDFFPYGLKALGELARWCAPAPLPTVDAKRANIVPPRMQQDRCVVRAMRQLRKIDGCLQRCRLVTPPLGDGEAPRLFLCALTQKWAG